MNAGLTAQRVYQELRYQIVSGALRPGERLDPAQLARPLASSATPVREALYMLTGEGLVDMRTGTGFFLPAIDAPGLQDLYDWTDQLTVLALANSAKIIRPLDTDHGSVAKRAAALFGAIASGSTNDQHHVAMARANASLHRARLVEPDVVADADTEIAAMIEAYAAEDHAVLRRLARIYHRRRRRLAAAIVRLIYRVA